MKTYDSLLEEVYTHVSQETTDMFDFSQPFPEGRFDDAAYWIVGEGCRRKNPIRKLRAAMRNSRAHRLHFAITLPE